jgi:ankyrin repeat protein
MLPLAQPPLYELPATFEQKRRFGTGVRIDVDERGIAVDEGHGQRRLRWIDVTRLEKRRNAILALADGAGGLVTIPPGIPDSRLLLNIVQERLSDAHTWRIRRAVHGVKADVPFYQPRTIAWAILSTAVVLTVGLAWFSLYYYLDALVSTISTLIYVGALTHVIVVGPSSIELRNRLRSVRVTPAMVHQVDLLVIENRGPVIALTLKNGELVELRGFGASTLTLYDRLRQVVTAAAQTSAPAIERRLDGRRATKYVASAAALVSLLLWLPVWSGRALTDGVRFLPLSTIEFLLDAGSAIERADRDGRTATYNAAKFGRLDVLQLLLSRGADPSRRASNAPGFTPLHVAAEYNQLDAVHVLLKAGVSPNVLNNWQQTPLMQLALQGKRLPAERAIADALLAAGADVNLADNKGFTVAHQADEPGVEWLIEVVAKRGANLNAQVHDSRQRPFDRAVLRREPSVARALAAAGADINLPASGSDDTWLYIAVVEKDVDRVKLLLDCGVRTDIVSQDGFLPLQAAVSLQQIEIARMLLAAGADVNASTPEIAAPLRLAVDERNVELANMLLAADATPDVASDGYSPLQVAADRGDAAMVAVLLDAGADPNAASTRYPPPITAASYRGHTEIVRLMLSRGASPRVVHQDWTPLRAARSGGHDAIVELLRAAGAR